MNPQNSTRIGLIWIIASHGISSVSNFLLSITIARATSAEEFGRFSIAFASYLVVLGVCRALTVEPRLVSARAVEQPRDDDAAALTVAGILGLSVAVVACLGLAVSSASPTLVLLAMGPPILLVQDDLRFIFFRRQLAHRAAVIDVVWLLIQIVILWRFGPSEGSFLPIASWLAGASASAVVGFSLGNRFLDLRRSVAWFRDIAGTATRYLVEFISTNSTPYLILWVLGSAFGLAAAAGYRGAHVLFGPFTVLIGAASSMLQTQAESLKAKSAETLRRAALRTSLLLGVGTVLIAAAAQLLPEAAGQAILGSSWQPTHKVIIPVGIYLLASALILGPGIGLRALHRAATAARIRVALSATTVAAVTVSALLTTNVATAVWAAALVHVVGAVVYWQAFLRELRSS